MPRALVVCALLCATLTLVCARGNYISVSRRQHSFAKDVTGRVVEGTGRGKYRAGSTVVMTGGVLTLGAYFADVYIGSPPVKFSVLVDTGSSNLVVPGAECTTCGKGASYNPKSSSSYAPFPCTSSACQKCTLDGSKNCLFDEPYCYPGTTGCAFGISYGGGSSLLAGYYVYDNVCFGKLCANATVGLGMAEYPADNMDGVGILGLASMFNGCNPTCVTTLFDSYVEQKLVSNMYGMCITPEDGGLIDLGDIDSSRYKGEIVYVPQEVDRWFNIILLDILVGKTSLGLPPFVYATTNDVIGTFVDSGTSVVLFGPLIFQQLQDVFQKQYCKLPHLCGNDTLFSGECYPSSEIEPYISQYPIITFTVQQTANKTVMFELPPSSYLMKADDQYCLGLAAVPGLGVVLGDLFMENYYVVFDRANQQLGFAPLASCTA